MGLVRYAPKFRITFYVMSILILLAGVGAVLVMQKDVLPEVNIPVVTAVWTYTGLDTPEMRQGVLRPVLMTAGAMFVGLLPMAIGIGQGSEQNAALARAVLGGISVGTCSTLLFVPSLYAMLRRGEAKPLEDYI